MWQREDDRAPVVAVLERRGRFLVGQPALRPGDALAVDDAGPAEVGDLVLLRPPRGAGRARVDRRIGRPDVARDVVEALLLHRGLRRAFPGKVHDAAAGAEAAATMTDRGRRDLRNVPTLTIDPADARDFDDAISAVATDEHVDVWVHIADVAAHVRPGDAVDGQARWRGTSVYVPGTVEPMLPEALSADACSLRPGVDRRTVSVRLAVARADGAVRVREVVRAWIRSDARLDYDHVDRVLAGTAPALAPWAEPLHAAHAAASALAARRAAAGGGLVVDGGEARYVLAEDGHVTEVRVERQTESHRLIEHLMVAANAAVAERLTTAGAPALHRIHERPDPDGVRRLVLQLAELGVPLPPAPDELDPEAAAELVVDCSRRAHEHAAAGGGGAGLGLLVLRALAQARYGVRGTGHAGLGLAHYCHFTSPIRRYPDLVVHRALLHLLGLGEEAPRAEDLTELATWCSATEREAMAIERAADAICGAFLLRRRLDGHAGPGRGAREQTFAGEVVGLSARGAYVRFGLVGPGSEADAEGAQRGFEGLLPVRLIGGDWWEQDELGVALVGRRSGARIRIGDPIDVRVARVDPMRGRVDLEPA